MKAEGGEKGVKGWRRIYGTGREKMDGKNGLGRGRGHRMGRTEA